ncbi:hypothetical protein FSP39_000257 [Pinctada imbricata]|uniref:Sterol regulatory element-binding protein cleavage-activating protein n=1 Tax=Pinctada imbricata TaxID=66713 RepID=A0AA89C5Z8_PINIB|nr:hypothetical protein FSP39_000257 [Pinctada imbricata]
MRSIQESVKQVYYTYGLFCASHPFSILTGMICFILITFYPLTHLPLPGTVPLEYSAPVKDFSIPQKVAAPVTGRRKVQLEETESPRWFQGQPVGYIQQIVVMTTVSPWKSQYMLPSDAFRLPLYKVFEILDEVEKIQIKEGEREYSVSDICLRVSEVVLDREAKSLFPQYSCLIMSPANFWKNDKKAYTDDGEILRTVFKRHSPPLESPPYVRDVLFGIPWKKSGISRYFIQNKQRTISYALTMVMKNYDQRFIQALRQKLESLYPETLKNVNNSEVSEIINVHYRESKFFSEYAYLLVTYMFLAMYLYFSVRKIEMVKSKWGLALSAVVTVVSSLLMSVSFCSVFGLTPTLNGGEIFPYLVVLVGLENILVITKSVVSTPVDLEVKYRIAQGISKEGWSITKNLATELIIVTGGFFTFVPAIQEFAMFALVGLLTDFFLQLGFFLTVLSIDIRRMELSDLNRARGIRTSTSDMLSYNIEPLVQCPVKSLIPTKSVAGSVPVTKKHRRTSSNISVGPPTPMGENSFSQESRRLRLMEILANTRMIQRFIMVCTVIWIGLIVYKTGLVEHLANSTLSNMPAPKTTNGEAPKPQGVELNAGKDPTTASWFPWSQDQNKNGYLRHTDLELHKELSYKHWPTMFGYYNISLYGKFISILPSIHVSVNIDPNEAISFRHPSENIGKSSEQLKKEIEEISKEMESGKIDEVLSDDKSLLEVLPSAMYDPEVLRKLYDPEELKKLYPKSKRELLATILLVVFSIICLSYFSVALYHCICPKNYAKWRARWFRRKSKQSQYFRQIVESVPKVLKGHLQEIECVITDGQFIISACLGGELRVWDSLSGDCVTAIHRKCATPPVTRKPCLGRNINDSDADLYAEYHGNGNHGSSIHDDDNDAITTDDTSTQSVRLRSRRVTAKPKSKQARKLFMNEPDLSGTIDTNFSQLKSPAASAPGNASFNSSMYSDSSFNVSDGSLQGSPNVSGIPTTCTSEGYQFGARFDQIYTEHKQSVEQSNIEEYGKEDHRARSWSAGDLPGITQHDAAWLDLGFENNQAPSIWCLACHDGLIVAGCGNGRIEFWDGATGSLKYMYGENHIGVTSLCFVNKRIVASRIDGSLDFLELETFHNPVISTVSQHNPPSSSHTKGHSRTKSQVTVPTQESLRKWEEIIHINLMKTVKAHQQPVIMLQCEGGRVVTASQDHTLKVFRLEDALCLFTLHGHNHKITVLYMDKGPPFHAASGDSDGTVRLWDLHTGSCLHKTRVHDGAIVALTCTAKHTICSGLDDRLCIFDRVRGNVVHVLEMDPCSNNSMALLTSNLLVTGGQGCINLVDINKGTILRRVNLGSIDRTAFVNQIKVVQNTVIVCDYASEMKVIQFPTILEKAE